MKRLGSFVGIHPITIDSQGKLFRSGLSPFLLTYNDRIDYMTLYRKRKGLDNFILVFYNHFLSLCQNGCYHILPFKLSSDEIGNTVNLNFPMKINLSHKGYLSLCNRQRETPLCISIKFESKPLRQMVQKLPRVVSEHPRESCPMLFLYKSPVGFFILIILQKSFVNSPQTSKGRARMSSQYPFLPKIVKTLNRGISSWFSLWNKYHVDTQKQMKSYNLGNTVRVSASSGSRHFIVHLGYLWNSHVLPCFKKMSAQGNRLFICKLTRPGSMPCNINRMKRVKSGNLVRTSEISWSHKVGLMEVSYLLSLKVRIRLPRTVLPLSPFIASFPVSGKNSSNGRNRRNIPNLLPLKFPMNNLCSNSTKGRTARLVGFQFFSYRKYLFNQTIRNFLPNSSRRTTAILETFVSLLLISFKPLRKPKSTPLYHTEYLIEATTFFIQMYCLTPLLIFFLILHRLFLLPKVFGRSLGDFY